MDEEKREMLDKMFNEARGRHDLIMSMQEMIADITGDKRLMVKCKMDRFIKKINDDILEEQEPCTKDFTPVLNILEQLIQCYEDIDKQ